MINQVIVCVDDNHHNPYLKSGFVYTIRKTYVCSCGNLLYDIGIDSPETENGNIANLCCNRCGCYAGPEWFDNHRFVSAYDWADLIKTVNDMKKELHLT